MAEIYKLLRFSEVVLCDLRFSLNEKTDLQHFIFFKCSPTSVITHANAENPRIVNEKALYYHYFRMQ